MKIKESTIQEKEAKMKRMEVLLEIKMLNNEWNIQV